MECSIQKNHAVDKSWQSRGGAVLGSAIVVACNHSLYCRDICSKYSLAKNVLNINIVNLVAVYLRLNVSNSIEVGSINPY